MQLGEKSAEEKIRNDANDDVEDEPRSMHKVRF